MYSKLVIGLYYYLKFFFYYLFLQILLIEKWYIYKIKCCVSDVCFYVLDNQLNDVNKDFDICKLYFVYFIDIM